MSSIFKSQQRNNSDSNSKSGTESGSKAPKNSSSAPPAKSGSTAAAATPASAPTAAAAPLPPNSKQSIVSSKQGKVERSKSFDTNALAQMDGFPIDSRLMESTVSDKTLSISRSGRFKAKGKARARLFSDESADGSADCPDGDRRGATTLSSPEDRQTVLDAMAMRSRRSPSLADGEVKSDGVTSPKWSATPNSLDL